MNVKTGELTSFPNAKTATQDFKKHEESRKQTTTKEHNKAPVADPKK